MTALAPTLSTGYTKGVRDVEDVAIIAQTQMAYVLNGGVFTAISGQTVDATPIGNTTPSHGQFTYVGESSATGLTAVGTNRATSLQLAAAVNVLSAVGSGTGVTLPSAATVGVGGHVIIFNNDSANLCQVYGAGSDTIDTIAAATGVPLTHAKRCMYIVTAAATWVSAQLGVVSA